MAHLEETEGKKLSLALVTSGPFPHLCPFPHLPEEWGIVLSHLRSKKGR